MIGSAKARHKFEGAQRVFSTGKIAREAQGGRHESAPSGKVKGNAKKQRGTCPSIDLFVDLLII